MNCNKIEHIISQLHPKLPNDGVVYAKHRDIQFRKSFDPEWKDILGNGSYCICILPLDPMNASNGGLYIDKNNYFSYYTDAVTQEEDLQWVEMEPGDLLFMHPHLWHGSRSNTSNSSRRTLLTGYCAYGANSRAYPGADMNRVLVRDPTTHEISQEYAPWAVVPSKDPDQIPDQAQIDIHSKHTAFH